MVMAEKTFRVDGSNGPCNAKSTRFVAIILLLFCLVLCFPSFNDSMAVRDDMPFHLGRIRSIAANLRLGSILPTIYGDAVNNFGYASPLFYPDVWLYIPALLTLSGMKLIRSYQIFIVLITLVTAVSMYFSTKRILASLQANQYYSQHSSRVLAIEQSIALLATVVYLVFPYRLINIYLRGALGEILTLIFLPLVACGLVEVFYVRKGKWQILVVGILGLLYSHIISLFMVSIFVLIFMVFNYRQSWHLKSKLLKVCLYSAGLGAAFLLPLIEQMHSNQFYYNIKNPFGSLSEQALTFCGSIPQVLLVIMHVTVFSFVYFLYVWLRDKKLYPRIALLLFLTAYLAIMTTNLFPWSLLNQIPLVKHIQFPWRIFLFVGYFVPWLCSLVLMSYLNKRSSVWYFSIIMVVLITGVFCVSFLLQITTSSMQSVDYAPSVISVGRGEYLPAKVEIATIAKPEVAPRIVSGKLSPTSYAKSGNTAEFNFNDASADLTLEFPIIYYKGYVASLDNRLVPVTQSSSGMIQVSVFDVNSGNLVIRYKHTLIQLTAYIISLTTAIYAVFRCFQTNQK